MRPGKFLKWRKNDDHNLVNFIRNLLQEMQAGKMETLLLKKSRTLVIPYVPISLNKQERIHWSKWHEEKQRWIHDIFFLVKETGKGIPMHREHVWITKIVIYFDLTRCRDESNFEPMIIKPLLDALVYAKIIDNDTNQYVSRPGRVDILIDRNKPRTEITLEWQE